RNGSAAIILVGPKFNIACAASGSAAAAISISAGGISAVHSVTAHNNINCAIGIKIRLQNKLNSVNGNSARVWRNASQVMGVECYVVEAVISKIIINSNGAGRAAQGFTINNGIAVGNYGNDVSVHSSV